MEKENNNHLNNEEKIISLEKRMLEILEENNELLKKIRSSQKLANNLKIAYWIIVISVAFGAYYLLQPAANSILNQFIGLKNVILNISDRLNNLPDFGKVKSVLNSIGK
ncbi:MAG: hypothetical protein WCO35_01170 [Candidatus Nomurabacteria bacterium]